MWKKHLGGWGKEKLKPAIGRPLLLETTLESDMLERLPTTYQAQQHLANEQSPYISPEGTPISAKFMKELPPLDFQSRHIEKHNARPVSEVPTASSVYTRQTPEARHDFDPRSAVKPLFAENSEENLVLDGKYHFANHQDHRSASAALPTTDSASTLHATVTDRERSTQYEALGIDTDHRQPWQGASGELDLMTPITATPAGTATSHSVSPLDEKPEQSVFPPKFKQTAYPTPDSTRHGLQRSIPLQPAMYLRTPEQDVDRPLSVGYDVSPWSTPESRPYHASVVDTTPERDVSYSRRPISASPSYGRQQNTRNRYTLGTQATDDEQYTEFEMSTAGTQHDLRTSGIGARKPSRIPVPVTPPSQQQQFRKSSREQQLDVDHYSPPRLSRFSWTTQATETTQQSKPERAAPNPLPRLQITTDLPAPTTAPLPSLKVLEAGVSPIMERRRPISHSPHLEGHPALTPKVSTPTGSDRTVLRKPTPSMLKEKTSSMFNVTPPASGKALPTTPSELSTVDYITTLAAQLESLSHKKHNLLKVIASHESVALAPGVNPLVIDLQKRKRTKEEIRVLQDDLAETRRSEHEIGLKLMRAEKRRDQEAPSALWVRRAAS